MDTPQTNRRSIRLPMYDYSDHGAYFVTICAHRRECIFGEVEDGAMRLNEVGRIVKEEWEKSIEIRNEIELDEFVVMPNHLHGIVWITDQPTVGANGVRPFDIRPSCEMGLRRTPLRLPVKSLSSFIAGFKSSATKRIRSINPNIGSVWQRNYYEHIIRDDKDLEEIQKYIFENPLKWEFDHENSSGRAPHAPTKLPIVGANGVRPINGVRPNEINKKNRPS